MGSWLYYALLGAICAALATIFAKIGLKGIDSLTVTGVRSAVMTGLIVLFLLALFLSGSWRPQVITGKAWIYVVLSAAAGAASWIFFFKALRLGEASKVAFIDRSSVLFVLVLSILLLGEKPVPLKIIGGLLIFVGLVLISIS
ncbi:MAG: EamA family transporter [Crenarchaeota archaeon]|nr:EamA family transporter [Thermoproteota archaeon]